MQNFMKIIINAIKNWTNGRINEKIQDTNLYIDRKIKDSTADWNQNDENVPGYIKNRTHWEKDERTKIYLEEKTINYFSLADDNFYTAKMWDNPIFLNEQLKLHKQYTINWDGIEYLTELQEAEGGYYFGHEYYYSQWEDTDLPFGIWMSYQGDRIFALQSNNSETVHSFAIYEGNYTIKKIDSKYLNFPTNLATTDDIQELHEQMGVDLSEVDAAKMDKNNPSGTGSFSMNRKANTKIGDYSHAEGSSTTASGMYSHAEGESSIASKSASHAEGRYTIASGYRSHAEGEWSKASGDASHAEGESSIASGFVSHAEGSSSKASGSISHAEGNYTTAYGGSSHAEGSHTFASGSSSHVQGKYNIPDQVYEMVITTITYQGFGSISDAYCATNYTFNAATGLYTLAENAKKVSSGLYGEFYIIHGGMSGSEMLYSDNLHILGNITNNNTTGGARKYTVKYNNEYAHAHIVGNGTSDTERSNAHTLDWDGNAWYQGDVYVGSTSGTNKDEGSKKLATEEYVDNAISGIEIPEGGNIELDATLTQEGQAADAKAVGDALATKITAPTTAVVGQTMIVKTVDENDMPIEWETKDVIQTQSDWMQTNENSIDFIKNKPVIPSIEGLATETYVDEAISAIEFPEVKEQIQADWNQIDGTQADYIRNKPFGIKADLYANSNLAFTILNENKPNYKHGLVNYKELDESQLDYDKEYTVIWDNSTYNLQLKQVTIETSTGNHLTGKLLGNANIATLALGINEVEDTGEPFAFIPAIGFYTRSTAATHSVVIKESDNIIKIDAQYLPDEIFDGLATETYVDEKIESINYPAQIQSDWDETDTTSPAYIKNKPAISSDGNVSSQVNWEQNEPTAIDYIKNKPFGEQKQLTTVFPSQICDNFFLNPDFGVYCQDYFDFTYNLEIGKEYSVNWDGQIYNCTAFDASILFNGDPCVGLGNGSPFGYPGNSEPFVFCCDNGSHWLILISLTDSEPGGIHQVEILKNDLTIKHLDNQYLNIDWSQIQNKPFYFESRNIDILPLTISHLFEYNDLLGKNLCCQIMPQQIKIIPGETYLVSWDEQNYYCIAQDCSNFRSGTVALGNCSEIGLSGFNEPFIIATVNNIGTIVFALTDTVEGMNHTFKVVKKESIKLIDNYYLSTSTFGDVPAGTIIVPEYKFNCNTTFNMNNNSLLIDIIPDFGSELWKYIKQDKIYNIFIDGNKIEGTGLVLDNIVGLIGQTDDIAIEILTPNGYKDIIITCNLPGEHIISIAFAENTTIQIDSKYLPDIINTNNSLPEVNTSNNGQIMTVVNGVWTAQTPASGLPKVSTSDAGKFLRVSTNGTWIVQSIPSAEGVSF